MGKAQSCPLGPSLASIPVPISALPPRKITLLDTEVVASKQLRHSTSHFPTFSKEVCSHQVYICSLMVSLQIINQLIWDEEKKRCIFRLTTMEVGQWVHLLLVARNRT